MKTTLMGVAVNRPQPAYANLMTLVIVSVHRKPGRILISGYACTPVLIKSSMRLAAQYVFTTHRNQAQHPIPI